jgi:hypothetical protein
VMCIVASLREIRTAMVRITQHPKYAVSNAGISSVAISKTKAKAKSVVHKTAARMCRLAALIGTCQIISMTCTIWTSSLLKTWTTSTDLWLKCNFEPAELREWDAVSKDPIFYSIPSFVLLMFVREAYYSGSLAPGEGGHLSTAFHSTLMKNVVWIYGGRRSLCCR